MTARGDDRGIGASLLMLAMAWLLLGVFRPYFVYDEGIPLVGGLRVLAGDVPYRDFYANYSPGQFYLNAVVFRVFGPSLIAQRLLSVVVRALLAWVAFVLMRRLAPRPGAAIGWALLLAWLGYFGAFGYTGFPALLFSLVSLLCTAKAIEGGPGAKRDGRGWLFVGGAAVGAALLFRQDFGVYAGAAQLAFFAVYGWFDPLDRCSTVVRRWSRLGLPFALGLAAILVVPGAYFINQIGLVELLRQLYTWPYELTKHFRGLPYPRPWDPLGRFIAGEYGWTQLLVGSGAALAFYLPPLVYLATAWTLVRRLRRDGSNSRFWLRLSLSLFGVLAFNQAVHRSDLLHLFPTFCVAVILLPSIVGPWIGAPRPWRYIRTWLAGLVLLLLLAPPAFVFRYATVPSLGGAPNEAESLPGARGIRPPPDQLAALNYVQGVTAPGEAVFVGNARHDRVLWNDIMFYFLARRPIPTRYHHFDPGLTTTTRVQREIIDELRRNDVRYIVLFSGAELPPEPNRSAEAGASLLDEYIRAHYRPVHRVVNYEVLRRTDD